MAKLVKLTEPPHIGDVVYHENAGLVKYKVNEKYLRDLYPEVITLTVIEDFGDGYFNPGHQSCRDWRELLREVESAKLVKVADGEHVKGGYMAFCPGCECGHLFDERWKFNEDLEKPTFTPSMLVNPNHPESRCHSYLADGKWVFLADCFHNLAGKTVEMVEI